MFAQDVDIEKLIDSEAQVEDQSSIIDYLEQLENTPLNINTASARELSVIPWLSPIIAVRIVQYRHDHGAFKQLDELYNVHGIKPIYAKISPFLTTGKQPLFLDAHAQGRHRLSSRREDSKAYQQHIYAGSKEKAFNRFKGSMSEYASVGLLIEKDAGEHQWNDLALANIVVNPGWSTTLLGGHFSAEFGQGLVFSGPYKMFKGSDPVAPAKQRSRGLVPYLSTAENYAFYGVGLSTRLQQFELHAFTSRQKKDARVEDEHIVSLSETGLHRAESELSIRDQLKERVDGVALEFTLGDIGHIGGAWQGSRYSHAFADVFAGTFDTFTGNQNYVGGCFFDLSFAAMNMFGEAATSESGGQAVLAGVWYDVEPIECVAIYRRYDENFINFYALGFGERLDTRNENGFYLGVRYRFSPSTTICYYVDQWQSPWPRTFVPMPGSGVDMLLAVEHQLSSLAKFSVQCRTEKKDDSYSSIDSLGNTFRYMDRPRRSKIRFQMDYNPDRKVKCRTRFEMTDYDQDGMFLQNGKIGTLLYQDIRWQPAPFLSIQTRWTLFDAPSYEHRFYQYENDVPGVMRLKMLNGRGKRWYMLCALKINNHFKFYLKYENLYIDDQSTIGSGNDIIHSQYENMFSLQLDWRF